jgi:hypothetical protein
MKAGGEYLDIFERQYMRVRCEDPNSLAVQLHSIFVVLKISYEIKIKRLETEKKRKLFCHNLRQKMTSYSI